MAQTPPAKAPNGPKVSGTRTIVSLVFLVVVLVVCGIELRAGLGQFLTLRSFDIVSENNLFKDKSFAEAQGMVAAFPSKSSVQVGEYEDVHHYYWYSLLRPLMGKENPEVFVSADRSSPPKALSFYTSTEGEIVNTPFDPNAAPAMTTMPSGSPMGMSMGMGGPPGGGPPGGQGSRPPLEDDAPDPAAADVPKTEGESGTAPTETAPTETAPTETAPTETAPTETAPTETAPTETAPTEAAPTEPAKDDEKSETPAVPN